MQTEKKMIVGLDELEKVVDTLYALRHQCKIYAFSGPLGAGKTTLAKLLLQRFGITEPTPSPTFTYVSIYENQEGQLVYHFDLYRIDTLDEFIESGFNEYLYQSNSWAIIEWPEVIEPLLDHQVCFVNLSYAKEDKRAIKLKVIA